MKLINELGDTIHKNLGWNKARIGCLVKMLLALLITRTVNLNKLACAFDSDAKQLSRYRRLQRFFAKFLIDYDQIAQLLFGFFFSLSDSVYLTVDRTNWQWGKKKMNILMLAVVYEGSAIPIYWMMLDKKGNSNTAERIALMEKLISRFGKECIAGLLGDREFIGEKWFRWLLSHKIPFYIRIKNNTITTNSRGQEVDIDGLFYGLQLGEQRLIEGKRLIWGHPLFLAGLRLEDGELLIVATSNEPTDAIQIYGLRWEIETLFGCLKGRGFHFEETHITDQERIKKLLVPLPFNFDRLIGHRHGVIFLLLNRH